MDANTETVKRGRGRPAANGNSNTTVKPGAAILKAFKEQFSHTGPDDLAIANEMVAIMQWTGTQYLSADGGPSEVQIEALTRLIGFAARNLNKASDAD